MGLNFIIVRYTDRVLQRFSMLETKVHAKCVWCVLTFLFPTEKRTVLDLMQSKAFYHQKHTFQLIGIFE